MALVLKLDREIAEGGWSVGGTTSGRNCSIGSAMLHTLEDRDEAQNSKNIQLVNVSRNANN
jgi:hypothetical protein